MVSKSKVPHANTRTLSRFIEGGGGEKVRVAVFLGGNYDASMEDHLAAEGVFAVAIKDPKPSDISEHPDFVLAPEWIRWLMPTPETSETWITSLGSSHDRNQLRKKLKGSHIESSDVRVEIGPLSVSDYKVWHESLYTPEIGGKTGAVLFWPKTEALSKKLTVTPLGAVADFYRIFMYHKEGTLIGGVLWSVSHSESSLTTRAAAFEQKARAKYELAIRGMEESILFAASHGLRWVSYGTDLNFYGVDMGIGLQRFKASIGMKPVLPKVGSFQLVKVLNKNLSQIHTANGEKPSVLIFAIGGNNLSDRVLNYQHLPPLTQRGNLDLLWSQDFGLTPIRFVAYPQTPAINVPKGMILQDIVLYGKEMDTVDPSTLTSLSDPSESAERTGGFTEPVHTIIAGGDVMLARDIPGLLARAGIGAPFRGVRPLLDRADIALVNLECVLSGKGDFFDKGEGRPLYYRCPPAMVNVLAEAGIPMVTTANNHAMDFGPEALADQSRILSEAGIAYAGSGANAKQASQPVFFRVGDLVVAILSFAADIPRFAAGEGKWGIFNVSLGKETLDRVRPAIEAARDSADLVIVSPHWGDNLRENPAEEIRGLARGLIDLGVDAIIGHSARILQGIEVYRGKPIVYDMGTALFDRVQENRMGHSALFELVFGQRGVERLVVHPVELEPGQVRLANDEEGAITRQLIKEMSRLLDPGIEFRENANALELHLMAQGITGRKREPENVHGKNRVRPTNQESGSLNEANIFLSDPPPGIDPGLCADLGRGLKVFGARFPERGRAGFGFMLEVFFRCPDTEGRRWRACIRGIDPQTDTNFRYRHPVAEGMWVPQGWRDERIINDRVVVRPPINLPPARYELYWSLVDADTGNLRKTSSDDPRVRDNWLHLGAIDLTKDAPRMVAGMSHAGISNASTRTLSRSIEGGGGEKVRVAVFLGGHYHANLEDHLVAEGFFAVAIKDPKPSDISEHPDFVLAPEWIRWLMPTPETSETWVTSLGSSHDRNRLRKKLKASHSESSDVRVEIKPLTVSDYKVWHESLYIPEIGGKTGAILIWPKAEALSKRMKVTPLGTVADFYRVFMYHKEGSLIGGSLWSVSHSKGSLIIAAAAFEQKARAKYELAIRGMEESILFATSHGLRWLSYGTDQNFYGVDMGIGLQSFKASIGMKPVLPRYGSFQLIKVLNKNLSQIHTANGEKPSVLIFAIGGNNLSDRVLNYQHLPPLTPKGSLDLLWSQDFGLKPIRFVADSQTPAINVPKGMILQDIVL